MARVNGEMVIAIDGPSGSGKSSTSRMVATRLGLAHLDTGSMYRALACAVSRAGINPQDEPDRVIDLAGSADIRVDTRPGRDTVVINGVDVTEEIRDPRTSARVSAVATIPQVRVLLVEQMRDIVERNDRRIVVEGRDITTVVCPDAQVRVLLVADPAVRMARRARELGDDVDQTQIHDQIVRRDRDDATVSQFETPAPGVTLIDSTSLGLDEVVARVMALAEQVGRRSSWRSAANLTEIM